MLLKPYAEYYAEYQGKVAELVSLFPLGEPRLVSGKLEAYGQLLQIVHPDHVAEASAGLLATLNEPVYRLSEGLTQPKIAGLVEQALTKLPALPEWIEPGHFDKVKWPAWADALKLAPYDALMDQYDPGNRTADLDLVFADLKTFLETGSPMDAPAA